MGGKDCNTLLVGQVPDPNLSRSVCTSQRGQGLGKGIFQQQNANNKVKQQVDLGMFGDVCQAVPVTLKRSDKGFSESSLKLDSVQSSLIFSLCLKRMKLRAA